MEHITTTLNPLSFCEFLVLVFDISRIVQILFVDGSKYPGLDAVQSVSGLFIATTLDGGKKPLLSRYT
jgi:hypothetical protein